MPAPLCPRAGCAGTLARPDLIVCTGDFAGLASMCRGKKRLGEPAAAWIAGDRGRVAYPCPLCRAWHTGRAVRDWSTLRAVAADTVAALRADERAGWRGVLLLADAWAPPGARREHWHVGLDQRQAYHEAQPSPPCATGTASVVAAPEAVRRSPRRTY